MAPMSPQAATRQLLSRDFERRFAKRLKTPEFGPMPLFLCVAEDAFRRFSRGHGASFEESLEALADGLDISLKKPMEQAKLWRQTLTDQPDWDWRQQWQGLGSMDWAERLSQLYEELISVRASATNKHLGAVYTPPGLAQRLLAVCAEQAPLPNSVCDPALGAASFLVQSARVLSAQGLAEAEVAARLFGIDCQALPVLASRLILTLALGCRPEHWCRQLRCDDSLKLSPSSRGLLPESFDWIVSNPPWVSYSGRHAAKPGDSPPAAIGLWPSLHGPFLVASAKMLASRGRMAVLLPSALGDLEGYKPVRAAVERLVGRPKRVIELGERVFPGVVAPTMLLLFENSQAPLLARATPLPARATPLPAGATPSLWLTPQSSEIAALVEHFQGWPVFPRECFRDTGIHTGNVAKKVLSESPRGPGIAPLREGRCLAKGYCLAPARRGIRAGLRFQKPEYWRIQSLDFYQRAPILLRQTADRPIAARHVDPGFFRNSLLGCFVPESWPIEWMLAVLNSELIGLLFWARHRDARQKSFPQVKIGHLRALPCPSPERQQGFGSEQSGTEQVCEWVRERERRGLSEARRGELDELLNNWVCQLYDFAPSRLRRLREAREQ